VTGKNDDMGSSQVIRSEIATNPSLGLIIRWLL